ncbi:MAG TPA: hypothetical protein VHV83_03535 [Armatimonadota bacterium]|nr:hypothetical protein [Armatimonadota bacterium]
MVRWFFVLLILTTAVPSLAVVLRSDGTVTVPSGQVINDDLVISGGTVQMMGTVNGDLVIAGGTVEVDGPVHGSLVVAGGNVTVRSAVDGSIYMAGGIIQLFSTVGRNVVVAGGTLNGDRGMVVGRDLVASGGDVTVAGTVRRNLRGSFGTLKLTDSARVGGNLTAMTSNPQIAAGAVISGTKRITSQPGGRHAGRGLGVFGWFLWQLMWGIALYIVGAIFIAIAPRITAQTQSVLRAHPWASLLTGLIIFAVVPVIFVILLITLVGIPLAFILLGVYFIVIFLSPIFPAIFLGRLILRDPNRSLYVALLVGLAVLVIIRLIPFLGSLVTFIAILLGIGALFLAWQSRAARPIYQVENP